MTKKKKILLLILLIISFPTLLIVIWYKLGHYYLPPFEGKVIDSEIKKPIEGAAVFAIYYRTTYTIAGSNSYPFDGQEARTDANGEFKIAEQSGWFGEITGWAPARLMIFKPGYGVFPSHKRSRAIDTNDNWPEPKKYIVYEIPRLKTFEERKINLLFDMPFDIQYAKRRYFTALINEERSSLGLQPYKISR